MRAGAILACAIAAAAPSPAAADIWDWLDRVQGGVLLHYELTALTIVDDGDAPPRANELVLAGVRLHSFIGRNASVGYHAGFDLAAGATIRDGGFAYDVALFPVGVAVRGGATGVFTIGAGVGAIGATGTLDDAVTVPVEASAEFGRGWRVIARARAAYVAGAAARQSAAPSIPFADELDAMLALRFGRRRDRARFALGHGTFPMGNGYFVGAAYRELAGARLLGVTIGYSIDLATQRRWTKRP